MIATDACTLADVGAAIVARLSGRVARSAGISLLADRVCLLVIDGLGLHSAIHHPAMAGRDHERLWRPAFTARSFAPCSTASNLASITTGVPPGQHGLLGYSVHLSDTADTFTFLRWTYQRPNPGGSVEAIPAAELQPVPTVFERLREIGAASDVVLPRGLAGTGYTAATLRGARVLEYETVEDLRRAVLAAAGGSAPAELVYGYYPAVDSTGHAFGLDSPQYVEQLRIVDDLVESLRDALPGGVNLVVTGDHGLVAVPETGRVDVADVPGLSTGVAAIGGEARFRYAYCAPGVRPAAVAERWRSALGGRMSVYTRQEVLDQGILSDVRAEFENRIGDVVAVANCGFALLDRAGFPEETGLRAFHGAPTPAEQLVPLLILVT